MPICIECRYPVSALYTTYSKADDKALGKGVRLTQCPRCKRFADKYVEHDFVVLFIDLVLIKPQVRRTILQSLKTRLQNPQSPSFSHDPGGAYNSFSITGLFTTSTRSSFVIIVL
jgi:hypothetical protein